MKSVVIPSNKLRGLRSRNRGVLPESLRLYVFDSLSPLEFQSQSEVVSAAKQNEP